VFTETSESDGTTRISRRRLKCAYAVKDGYALGPCGRQRLGELSGNDVRFSDEGLTVPLRKVPTRGWTQRTAAVHRGGVHGAKCTTWFFWSVGA